MLGTMGYRNASTYTFVAQPHDICHRPGPTILHNNLKHNVAVNNTCTHINQSYRSCANILLLLNDFVRCVMKCKQIANQ